MKITVNVDCTPQEARTFLGLPDVKPMQDALMKELQDRMSANLSAMDPETMVKTWLPTGMQNLESIQRLFWSHLTGSRAGGGDTSGGEDK